MKIVAGIVGFVALVAAFMALARYGAGVPLTPANSARDTRPLATDATDDAADAADARDDTQDETPPLPALFVFKDDAHPEPIALAGVRKKPALLHLWASWCGPCRAELPSLLAVGKKGAFDVVAVSVDDRFPDVRRYFEDKIPPEIVWDKNITLERALGVESIPTTFVVDVRGNVVDRFQGAQDWSSPEMTRTLAAY